VFYRALEAQHGEAMVQLTELEHAIGLAELAVETGRDEVRQETGLDPRAFDERAAPFEAKEAPKNWLVKRSEDGKEVIHVVRSSKSTLTGQSQFTNRPATAEEIADGAFYANADEYRQATGTDDAAA
jgi:hypothetical protein